MELSEEGSLKATELAADELGILDSKRALQLQLKAAEQGYPVSMMSAGVMYYWGTDAIEPDMKEGVKWLDKAIEAGDATACAFRGLVYTGEGKLDKAVAMFKKGADMGDRDSEWSFARLKGMAKAGEPLSQYLLGEAYEKGIGTRRNYEEAAKWYRLAADQNLAEAQYSLACCYVNGYGV